MHIQFIILNLRRSLMKVLVNLLKTFPPDTLKWTVPFVSYQSIYIMPLMSKFESKSGSYKSCGTCYEKFHLYQIFILILGFAFIAYRSFDIAMIAWIANAGRMLFVEIVMMHKTNPRGMAPNVSFFPLGTWTRAYILIFKATVNSIPRRSINGKTSIPRKA